MSSLSLFLSSLQSFSKIVDNLCTDPVTQPVPYNSSKLTRILEPMLGNNCITNALITLEGRDKGMADLSHNIEIGDKLKKIKNSAKINKNMTNNGIRDLRDEIKKIRGKLNLTANGSYLHDIDPNLLKTLKSLISELDRLKLNTWEKKRDLSIQYQNDRKKNLETEGLLYTLTVDLDIPENITISSKNLLISIVQQKAMIDDTENEYNEKKNLYQLRLDAWHKKNAGNQKEEKDDKITKLEKNMLEAEDKLVSIYLFI